MGVEIVWQAYNEEAADRAWGGLPIAALYQQVLRDDYRKKVDPRSMLFHRTQQFVLNDLGQLMKWGASEVSLEQYWARAFSLGFEELPLAGGDLGFDYRLISHYTSLRMADDYNQVERIFDSLFRRCGAVAPAAEPWTFFGLESVDPLFHSLGEISIHDLVQFIDRQGKETGLTIESLSLLIQNYVEFYRYARNNRLTPFYFNSAANPIKWGNLAQRKDLRRRRVVERALSRQTATAGREPGGPRPHPGRREKTGVMERLRRQQRLEQFLRGLADGDPLVRQKSVEYLAVPGAENHLPHLLALLNDQPEIRQEVVRALGEIGSAQAVPPLLQLLQKEDQPAVRKSAAYSLTHLGTREGLLVLLEMLPDEQLDVSCEMFLHPLLPQEPEAAAGINYYWKAGPPAVRAKAAFLAGRLTDRRSAEWLLQALREGEGEVVLYAAAAAARRNLEGAKAALKARRKRAAALTEQLVIEESLARLEGC